MPSRVAILVRPQPGTPGRVARLELGDAPPGAPRCDSCPRASQLSVDGVHYCQWCIAGLIEHAKRDDEDFRRDSCIVCGHTFVPSQVCQSCR